MPQICGGRSLRNVASESRFALLRRRFARRMCAEFIHATSETIFGRRAERFAPCCKFEMERLVVTPAPLDAIAGPRVRDSARDGSPSR